MSILALASSAMLVFHCVGTEGQSKFALTFEQRGDRISEVTLGQADVPRVGNDTDTSWTGKEVDGTVTFAYRGGPKAGFSAGMTLKPNSKDSGKYLLEWSETTGGGHIWLTSEGSATCVVPEFAKPQDASK